MGLLIKDIIEIKKKITLIRNFLKDADVKITIENINDAQLMYIKFDFPKSIISLKANKINPKIVGTWIEFIYDDFIISISEKGLSSVYNKIYK